VARSFHLGVPEKSGQGLIVRPKSEPNNSRLGVSPAYFISRFSDRFTPLQVSVSLEELKEMGYEAVELEVYHRDTLDEWEKEGADRVARALEATGLSVSQFVAHFLLHGFDSPTSIRTPQRLEEIDQMLSVLDRFPNCRLVTIPLGQFDFDDDLHLRSIAYSALYAAFLSKLASVVGLIERTGRRCALELIPGAFISGTDGLTRLFGDLGSPTLGYNFDTGHANSSKEQIGLVPFKLQGRILGTHLCDNYGNENLSLRPGAGNIHWGRVFRALNETKYAGCFDVEIRCDARSTQREYEQAIGFVRDHLTRASDVFAGAAENKPNSHKEFDR